MSKTSKTKVAEATAQTKPAADKPAVDKPAASKPASRKPSSPAAKPAKIVAETAKPARGGRAPSL